MMRLKSNGSSLDSRCITEVLEPFDPFMRARFGDPVETIEIGGDGWD
jgi:hypothetical protein